MGDRGETPLLRLYARLPGAEQYRSDAYAVYGHWLPPDRHVVGKGGAVNWNEGWHSWPRSQLNRLARDTTGYERVHQERANAGVLAGPDGGGLDCPIQCQFMLRTPCNPTV